VTDHRNAAPPERRRSSRKDTDVPPSIDPPIVPGMPGGDDLVFHSARSMIAGLRRREFSAQELLAAHLERIAAVNPAINAVVTLDIEGAQRGATESDRRRMAGERIGALDGLPISFKDTHATAGLRTTYGSPRHTDLIPQQDDEIVRRIMTAGAVRVGKTNVPEFAAGSHTFNDVFGTTRNPWALDRSAGGSSGGAAAALAAGMQPIADGSDMGGSLRNPASFCHVVGLRPTPGRVPSPTTPLGWSSLSVDGPMARTVGDVGLLLSVVAGANRDDPLSLGENPAAFAAPGPVDLRGLRVAWAPTLGNRVPVDRRVLEVLESAVRVFESGGADVEFDCPDLDGADFAFRTLRAAEFELRWHAELAAEPETFKADLAWNIRQGAPSSGREVLAAQAELTRLYRAANRFFDRFDVLLAPVSQLPPFDADLLWPTEIDGVAQQNYLDWMASCYLITTLGTPAMSVPAGFTADGLPVGLQIITRAGSELQLLGIGEAFEQANGAAATTVGRP
jgi:amidase